MKIGVAERILFDQLTADAVVRTVRKVIEDPKYRTNIQKRSARFRDQPEKPLDRAVWWVEYILRNPNPEHLRSPVRKLGAFVANLYDIILFFVLLILAVGFVLWKYVFSKIHRGPKRSGEKVKQR